MILIDREYSARPLTERAFQSIGRSVVLAYVAWLRPTAPGLVKAGLGVADVARSTAGEAADLVGLGARPVDYPM